MNDKKTGKQAESDSDKIAINFYISQATLEKIDDFLFYVKKRLPIEKRRKLTRSVFYEIGLKTAIEDYNKKGEESVLWKSICELIRD